MIEFTVFFFNWKQIKQFTTLKERKIFNGKDHNCELLDAVRYKDTRVYIFHYMDKTCNQIRKDLFFMGSDHMSMIPLKIKDGLDELFDEIRKSSPPCDLEKIFAVKLKKPVMRFSPFNSLERFKKFYGHKVRINIQYPYVKGSDLFDGTKHICDAVDCVRISEWSCYAVEYYDYKLNKWRIALFNRVATKVLHIPLMDSTGMNKLFEKNKLKWQRKEKNGKYIGGQYISEPLPVTELFRNCTDIGMTATYKNYEAFFEEREKVKREKEEERKRKAAQQAYRDRTTETETSPFMEAVLQECRKVPEKEPERSYYKGHLFVDDGKGPLGLPSSSYWYSDDNKLL